MVVQKSHPIVKPLGVKKRNGMNYSNDEHTTELKSTKQAHQTDCQIKITFPSGEIIFKNSF
jgi:hypothetical protein